MQQTCGKRVQGEFSSLERKQFKFQRWRQETGAKVRLLEKSANALSFNTWVASCNNVSSPSVSAAAATDTRASRGSGHDKLLRHSAARDAIPRREASRKQDTSNSGHAERSSLLYLQAVSHHPRAELRHVLNIRIQEGRHQNSIKLKEKTLVCGSVLPINVVNNAANGFWVNARNHVFW